MIPRHFVRSMANVGVRGALRPALMRKRIGRERLLFLRLRGSLAICLSTCFQARLYLPVYSLFQMGMLLAVSLAANVFLEGFKDRFIRSATSVAAQSVTRSGL